MENEVAVALISGITAILVAAIGFVASKYARRNEKIDSADNALVEGYERQLEIRDDMVRLRDDVIAVKEETIKARDDKLLYKEQIITELRRQLKERDEDV